MMQSIEILAAIKLHFLILSHLLASYDVIDKHDLNTSLFVSEVKTNEVVGIIILFWLMINWLDLKQKRYKRSHDLYFSEKNVFLFAYKYMNR